MRTLIQGVSQSLVFEQIRTTDGSDWTPIQRVSHSSADQNHWWEWLKINPGSELLFSFLSRSEPLMRIEHPSRKWVAIQFFEQRTTDKSGWIPIQNVGHSPVFEPIKTTDENGWTPIQDVSHSPVFEQIRITDKNGWLLSVDCKLLSKVFEQIKTTNEGGWTPF